MVSIIVPVYKVEKYLLFYMETLYKDVPLYIISNILESVMVYAVAILLSKRRFLQFLDRDSMYCYGLHYLVIG